MAVGSYWEISKSRQKLITELAHRKRRTFNVWQRQQIAIWRRALEKNQELPEQQRFYMRDIEEALIYRGDLEREQGILL